jgi:hypothetical protein
MNAPHADTVTRPIGFVRDPISDEDIARANHYALISRLFHAAPDDALLDTLAAVRPTGRSRTMRRPPKPC